MTQIFQRWRIALTALLASITLLLVTFASAPFAVADTTDNIDPAQEASLTIHKHEKPDTQGIGNGEVITPAPENPISGVKFKVRKLNLDISDPKVWQGLETLTYDGSTVQIRYPGAGSASSVTLGDAQEKITTGDGTAAFTGLNAGAYLVEELEWTTAPNGQFIAEKSEPFFVTLPMKRPDNNKWNYNVHAYPKNSLSTISKSIDDSAAFNAANTGELITWVITATMPKNTDLTKVSVVDTFDSRIDPASITVQKVTAKPASGTETEIPTTDYNLDVTGSKATVSLTNPSNVEEQEVKIYFTGGVKPLANANTPDNILSSGGVIPNKATVTINEQSTETNEVNTKWGDLAIFKYSQTDEKKPLKGAVFDIYRANDSGQCNETDGTKIGSVTTDALGRAYARLKVGENYCLVETTAPAGFKSLTGPVSFNVEEGKFVDTAGTEKNFVQIANEKTDYPALPLTGATGKLIMSIIGLALMALAIGLFIVHKRRQREEN